jgi:hypothetical protein
MEKMRSMTAFFLLPQVNFCAERQKKVMETLATEKVSIVLCPIKKKKSERKNKAKIARPVYAIWCKIHYHG